MGFGADLDVWTGAEKRKYLYLQRIANKRCILFCSHVVNICKARGTHRLKKSSCSKQGFDLQTVQPVASRYTDCVIPVPYP